MKKLLPFLFLLCSCASLHKVGETVTLKKGMCHDNVQVEVVNVKEHDGQTVYTVKEICNSNVTLIYNTLWSNVKKEEKEKTGKILR